MHTGNQHHHHHQLIYSTPTTLAQADSALRFVTSDMRHNTIEKHLLTYRHTLKQVIATSLFKTAYFQMSFKNIH